MRKVFLASNDKLLFPLTIIADGKNEAIRIFNAWVERHLPIATCDQTRLKLVTVTALALQPQLAEAAGAGVVGVGYWISHRAGWVVAAPQEEQLGAITPMDPFVRCYSVVDDDGEMFAFAHSMDEAVTFYTQWSMLAYGEMDETFSVEEVSRWLLRGPQASLREDMDAGLLGIGSVSEDGFWRVWPADYEPTFGR